MPPVNTNQNSVILRFEAEDKRLHTALTNLTKRFDAFQKLVASGANVSIKAQQASLKMFDKEQKYLTKQLDLLKKRKKEYEETEKKVKKLGATWRRVLIGDKGSWGRRLGFEGFTRKGGALGSVARAGLGLGSGLVGFLTGMTSGAYRNWVGYHQSRASLAGFSGRSRDVLRALGVGTGGVRWGYSPTESLQHAQQVWRNTGVYSGGKAVDVSRFQMMSRAYGVGVGELGGLAGTFTRAGLGFGGEGSQGEKMMRDIFAGAIKDGLAESRLPEVMVDIKGLTEQQLQYQIQGGIDIRGLAAGMSLMRRAGIGIPGQIMSRMGSALINPPSPEAEATIMASMGWSERSIRKKGMMPAYFDILMRRYRGANAENILDVIGQIEKTVPLVNDNYHGLSARATMLHRQFNLSPQHALSLLEKHGGGKGKLTVADIEKAMKESRSLDEQAAQASVDMLKVSRDIAENTKNLIETADKDIGPNLLKLQKATVDAYAKLVPAILERLVPAIENLVSIMSSTGEFWGNYLGSKKKTRGERVTEAYEKQFGGIWNKFSSGQPLTPYEKKWVETHPVGEYIGQSMRNDVATMLKKKGMWGSVKQEMQGPNAYWTERVRSLVGNFGYYGEQKGKMQGRVNQMLATPEEIEASHFNTILNATRAFEQSGLGNKMFLVYGENMLNEFMDTLNKKVEGSGLILKARDVTDPTVNAVFGAYGIHTTNELLKDLDDKFRILIELEQQKKSKYGIYRGTLGGVRAGAGTQ